MKNHFPPYFTVSHTLLSNDRIMRYGSFHSSRTGEMPRLCTKNRRHMLLTAGMTVLYSFFFVIRHLATQIEGTG